MTMTRKTLTAAIALSVIAGSFAVPASAATMIRAKPVEAAQKAENVGYYGYYGYRYYPRYHYRRHYHYNYYYGY